MFNLFSRKNPVLLNKNFTLLWIGKAVSQLGNWIHYLGIVAFVPILTGSMVHTGLILGVSIIPTVVLGPIAGSLADKWDRKKIIVYTDLISGICALYLGIRAFGDISLFEVYLVTIALGVCKTFFSPALNASIPNIIQSDQLSRANSLMKITTSMVEILGPLGSGFIIVLLGAPISFVVNGISFILSGISESFAIIPQTKVEQTEKSVWRDAFEGLKFIAQNKIISSIIFTFSAMIFFVAPMVLILKVLCKDYYGLGALELSIIFSADALGVLFGSGYLIVKPVFKKEALISISFPIFSGIALLIIGNIYNFYLAVIVMFLQGFVSGMGEISIMTIFQRATPDDKRGKVFGLYGMLSLVLAPVSMALFGVLVEKLSVALILDMAGISLIFGGIFLTKRLRQEGLFSSEATSNSM